MPTLYTPRDGSKADLVIQHLKAKGGWLTYDAIDHHFGVTRNNITAAFGKAMNSRLLEKGRAPDGSAALRIPGPKVATQPAPAPAAKRAAADDKGSPFINPSTSLKGQLPAGKILMSAWSDGEIYVHGLQVMTDGSVLFTKAQMREIVVNMADPLGIRI